MRVSSNVLPPPIDHCMQNMIERGVYLFTFGSPDSKVDFLHIDNLVQAHHLAGEALLSQEAPAVSI